MLLPPNSEELIKEKYSVRLINYSVRKEGRNQTPRHIAADVEAIFGIIKHHKGFKRFRLRGLEKVEIETLLIAIGHNISKMGNQRVA